MGLLRKTASLTTMGAIRYRTNTERRATAASRNSRAAKRIAKAEAKLLDAQRKALPHPQAPSTEGDNLQ
jgi:hypothetical protein